MSDPVYLSTNQLCDLFGLNPRTISELVGRGVIPRVAKSQFELRAAVRGYTAHLRDAAAGRGAMGPGLSIERERLVREQADKVASKNAQARGELLPAKEVEAAWATILRDVKAGFLAMPGRLQQRLMHLTPSDIAAIDSEIRECLTGLADDEL